jgi:hypothetical protein
MQRPIALAVVLFVLPLFPASVATAQDFVTTDTVWLRRSPSMTGARLRALPADDTLSLRNVPPRNAFVPVRTKDGKAGWVGELYLRDLHVTVAAAATRLETDANGAAFARISPDWEKPPLGRSNIRVKGGAELCHPEGDAHPDDATNVHKNRSDIPATSYFVTVDAIRALPDTALWRFTQTTNWRKAWKTTDSALVTPYEGIPVTVEGYFEVVKPQKASPPTGTRKVGESPNCHAWAEKDTDWHIALVSDPSEREEQAVVIEPTPRTKRHNAGWTFETARLLAVRHSDSPTAVRHEAEAARVRVTGFLMLDPVHPKHIRGGCDLHHCTTPCCFRATLWEVHPVTRIEVLRNNEWEDLNKLP